jgi:hypothetical protein
MIDLLIVIVTYLGLSFSAPAESGRQQPIRLPSGAESDLEMIDAPIVAVTSSQILVDGAPAGMSSDYSGGGVLRIDALFSILNEKRELWQELHLGEAYPGVAVLAIDADAPGCLVKSVVSTAAAAGHPQLSFLDARQVTSSSAL